MEDREGNAPDMGHAGSSGGAVVEGGSESKEEKRSEGSQESLASEVPNEERERREELSDQWCLQV